MLQSSGSDIIRDTTENDSYVWSMDYGFGLFEDAYAKYKFDDRDNTVYPPGFAGLINEKFQDLRNVKASPDKIAFFKKRWDFIPPEFFDWFARFRFNPEFVNFWQDEEGHLQGYIIGPIKLTIFFESVLMAIISQTYNEEMGWLPDDNWLDELFVIIDNLVEANLLTAEFGMRRRAYNWMQDEVNYYLLKRGGSFLDGGIYTGSSTPYHSHMVDLSPKGTVAHQWYAFHAAVYGVEQANQMALNNWYKVYGKNVDTALTDTFMSDFFWATLDPEMARLISKYRQDSGDPFKWIDHAFRYFTHPSIGIDPGSKTLMFTDGLDYHKAKIISKYVRSLGFKDAYGMGGHFTNNKLFFKKTPAYRPLRIVIKLVAVSLDFGVTWLRTGKLSDEPGKHTGDPDLIAHYLDVANRYPFPY